MDGEISLAIKKRNTLFRAAKRSGKPADRAKYTAKRNQTTALLRKSKQSFFNKLNNADAKTFWKFVKSLNQKSTSMPTLQHNGTKLETSECKADALNKYFYTCFNHNFPPLTNPDFSFENLNADNCPKELLCTEEAVFTHLEELDTSKSTGCDLVTAKMLKSTAASITSSITTLFNISISTGVFPTEWKTARIVPIPKGNDQTILPGYRPISVLPIASKVLERHVKSIIEAHLQEHSPISPRQWGFVSSRSTVSALIKVVDDCLQALDKGYEVCMIFFDVRKAFDTVPHLPLLHIFEELGLNKYLLRWLKNYLFNRTQYVAVEGADSHRLPVISGVPQGSVLGPLLFICYINEVVSVISDSSQINLFADDMVLYRFIKSSADYLQLQQDVDSITSCTRSKHLNFNTSKCRQMFISRKRGLSVAPPNLTIDGTPLITVTEYKYLGVTITSDMSWSPHITNICNKTRKLIGLLYRRFYQNSNSQTLLTLYKSFIRPHLEYSSAVWNPHLKGEIEALEKVQKFALRVCTKSWDSDYNALLSRTSLPSLQTRRVQASLCHLYKIIHNLTDFPEAPVSNRVIPYHSRYVNTQSLNLLPFKTSAYQNSFFPSAICNWNKLPKEILECDSLWSFKRKLLAITT